ncbi:unnamed protein product [Polarella glacialis]|uniref:site-specific DNA-methyltransferase (adenine-specific) n=1 Tax=Polarella glacialis TaxID=89957 RepID=A0A813FX22_POLGL|nr:unnamed protein product [Polarella glacialis]
MAQQWVAVKWLPNRGKEGAFAFACQAEGRKPWDFYTTVKKARGRKEEACRIARLCYAKFQAGAADAEVMEYRDSLCRELTAGQRPFLNQKSYDKHVAAATCRRPFLNKKPYDKHVAAAKFLRAQDVTAAKCLRAQDLAAAKCLRAQGSVATQGRLLSWLGSKFQARSLILACIPMEVQVREVVSPFFGSGAAELELLRERRHVKVRASDADAALVNFWQQVLASPQAVANQLSGIIPATRAVTAVEFDVMQRSLTRIREGAVMAKAPAVLAAARFWAVNQLCFSGQMRSRFQGPQALKLQRGREQKLQRVRVFQPPAALRLQLAATDYVESVRKSPKGALLFLDPPYLQEDGSREKLTRGGLSHARYACGPNFGLQAHTQLR